MNPTAKNIATNKEWSGVRYQWLGKKEIWKFLNKANLFSNELLEEVLSKKPKEWTPEFCIKVYDEVAKNDVYITNLAKCSQTDAKYLPDSVFMEYKSLFLQEVSLVNPAKVVLFGNQVSSIVLDQPISVSKFRKQCFELHIENKVYKTFSVHYPVGNGRFNIDKAIEDLVYVTKL